MENKDHVELRTDNHTSDPAVLVDILAHIQEDIKQLKSKESNLRSDISLDDVVVKSIQEIKQEILELKGVLADNPERQGPSSQTLMPNMQAKGMGAPAGMSTEQLQEFKKQTLQINGMQQKVKDLEQKLTEAVIAIKKGHDRAGELEDKSVENVKDLYSTIDQINNSLSEKIAQQRVEMQKLAGDTPKAVNYDPFNYGEAYAGDFVDFQSRKRITEIKLLLQSLQAALNSLRDSVKVSPAIDLGYKVVRLDQLILGSGFKQAIANGEASQEDVVVITQQTAREPGRQEMPRKEMFQTTEDMESKWAITDSMMQTMYRLETELAELQKVVGTSDASGSSRIIEELQTSVRQLKEKQVDIKTVRRLIEDQTPVPTGLVVPKSSMDFRYQIRDSASREEWQARAGNEEAMKSIRSLQLTVEGMVKRFNELDLSSDLRPTAAVRKTTKQDESTAACLSCDRGVEPVYTSKPASAFIPKSGLYEVAKKTMEVYNTLPPRMKYVLTRAYNMDTSGIAMDVYSIPRPCGASYPVYWPVVEMRTLSGNDQPVPSREKFEDMQNVFVRGVDGRYYIGSNVPAGQSEFAKKTPVAILKSTVHRKTKAHPDGEITEHDEVIFQGKRAVVTKTSPQKTWQRAVKQQPMSVDGQKSKKPIPTAAAVKPDKEQEGDATEGDPEKTQVKLETVEQTEPAQEELQQGVEGSQEGVEGIHDGVEDDQDEVDENEEAAEFDNAAFFGDEDE